MVTKKKKKKKQRPNFQMQITIFFLALYSQAPVDGWNYKMVIWILIKWLAESYHVTSMLYLFYINHQCWGFNFDGFKTKKKKVWYCYLPAESTACFLCVSCNPGKKDYQKVLWMTSSQPVKKWLSKSTIPGFPG